MARLFSKERCSTGLFIVSLSIVLFSRNSTAPTLREEADLCNRMIGSAARASQLGEPLYAATLAREFSLLEPEDELKWEIIHPAEETFNFLPADQLLSFAHRNHMRMRGHTLLWHKQLPRWLTDGHFSSSQLRAFMKAHIEAVVSHYRGQIFAWDVVNEAFDENGNLRSTLWSDHPGISTGNHKDFIELTFRWARDADPSALLFLNDAEAETINRKSDAILRFVKDFKSRGVPIDGVGLQMHIFDLHPDFEGIEANMQRFASLGLQIHITEMDVAVPTNPDGTMRNAMDGIRQAEIYRRIAEICFSEPQCTAFQTWGFTDKYSWVRSSTHGTHGDALLFSNQYVAKASYVALQEGIRAASYAAPKSAGSTP